MIEIQKLIDAANLHIKRGDSMQMDPKVIKDLATMHIPKRPSPERIREIITGSGTFTKRSADPVGHLEWFAETLLDEVFGPDKKI